MVIPRFNSVKTQLSTLSTDNSIDPDERLRRYLEDTQKSDQPTTNTEEITEIAVIESTEERNDEDEENIGLLKKDDLDHIKDRLYFHVWSDEKYVCATDKDIELNPLYDYMVMILRFPFSSRNQYFPTATSFVDSAFADMKYIDSEKLLKDLDLD